MKVEPIAGEALRYYVESWSRPKLPYLVDLAENHGNGACSCTDFITRRQIAIRAGSPLFTRETSCRHCIAARKHFTIQTLTHAAALVKQQERPGHRRPAPTTSPAQKPTTSRPPYEGYC